MINKCMVKIIKRELYNIRDPPWKRDQKIERKRTVAIKIVLIIRSTDLY